MRTLLSLSLCLLLVAACSDPEDPPATDTGSDTSVVPDAGSDPTDTATEPTDTGPTDTGPTDTGTAPCPDDWEAANGTPCDQPGQNCNNCNDPCFPCWILSCEGGTWITMESFPPPDACTDAGSPPLDEGSTTDAGAGEFTWFTSCGDPVCHGWTEKPDMPACTEEAVGGACASEGSSCDPHPCATGEGDCDPTSGCNGVLTCASSDPKEAGCPISQRAAKHDIHYLNDVERRALYEKLTQIPLASWRYKNLGPSAPESIGFIIEDLKQSPAVQSTGERVNLYGYTTMAVAAFQVQAQQIKSLQGELEALRTDLQGIRKGCAK